MKLDALIIAAHPDDAEIALGGTILRMAQAGKAVGVLDLTRGELGSRGDREGRDREAEEAASLLGLAQRAGPIRPGSMGQAQWAGAPLHLLRLE